MPAPDMSHFFSGSELAAAQADVYALLEEHGHSAWSYGRLGLALDPLLEVAGEWVGDDIAA